MNLFERAVAAVERAAALERPQQAAHNLAARLFPGGRIKDVLSGSWLGHPVHPALVGLPIGAFLGASVLDARSRAGDPSADTLVWLGLVSAVPTAAAGTADWTDTTGPEQRVGFAHAGSNAAALSLYGLSLVARGRGRRGLGAGLAAGGAGLLAAGGYLGGHLSYALGVGVDTTAFHAGDLDWTGVLDDADLGHGETRALDVEGTSVLVTRRADRVLALANRCTHRGGPLADGERDGGCLTCPWHGSAFDLETGAVVRGPATRAQPIYQVRIVDGRIQLSRSGSAHLRTNPV